MTNYEILTLVIAAISLIVAALAYVRSSSASEQANNIASENLKLQHAQVENDLEAKITASRNRMEDFIAANGDSLELTDSDPKKRRRLELLGKSVIEGYLNSLDEACQRYNDEKIDTVRFKKARQVEIRNAVQSEAHKDFLKPGAYNALRGVFEEWENPEKK